MASWDYPPLGTVHTHNGNYFDDQVSKGDALIADAKFSIDALIAQGIPALDFSGVALSQVDPTTISLALPTAPSVSAIISPTLGNDPDDTEIKALLATIKAALESRLANPTGLLPAVEDALFSRATDRESKAQAETYENYLTSQASNGFSSPSGQDQAAFIAFETERKSKMSDINRDIMIKQADLEQSNLQKTLDAMLTLESNHLAFYNAQEDVMVNRVNLLDKINQTIIENKRLEVQIYASTSDAFSSKATFLMRQLDTISSQSKDIANLELEKIRAEASFEVSKYNALANSTEAVGSILGQYAATLANMMNYSVSYGYGTHYSGNVSVSV